MKKKILSKSIVVVAALLTASVMPATVNAAVTIVNKDVGGQKLKVKLFGYSQITAESGNGLGRSANDEKNGLRFGADRVRLGYKLSLGKAFSKLQIDFNKTDSSANPGQLPEIVKDAVVGYKFDKAASLSLGQFKTPVGMDFNTSGAKLDITKRGMEKKLVLERSAGAMLSGRKIGGVFGYDIGIFNPATRSAAVGDPDSLKSASTEYGAPGNDYAYALRGMVDWQKLHIEVSYGQSGEAAGSKYTPGTKDADYSVWDIGARYKVNNLTLKGEYIAGNDVKGVNGQDETVWYLHAGYRFLPMVEGVVRHYQAKYEKGSVSSDLGNTYLGLNIFFNPASIYQARLQLDYVIASGDDGWGANSYVKQSGVVTKGYADNVILVQFQVGF